MNKKPSDLLKRASKKIQRGGRKMRHQEERRSRTLRTLRGNGDGTRTRRRQSQTHLASLISGMTGQLSGTERKREKDCSGAKSEQKIGGRVLIIYIVSGYDTPGEKLMRTAETITCQGPLLLVKSFRKLFFILHCPWGLHGSMFATHGTLVVMEMAE